MYVKKYFFISFLFTVNKKIDFDFDFDFCKIKTCDRKEKVSVARMFDYTRITFHLSNATPLLGKKNLQLI